MSLKTRLDEMFNNRDIFISQGFVKITADGCPVTYELVADYYDVCIIIHKNDVVQIISCNGFSVTNNYTYDDYLRDFGYHMQTIYDVIHIHYNRDM